MFVLIISIIFFVVAGIFLIAVKWSKDDDWLVGTGFFGVSGAIILFASFFFSMISYSGQLSDIEDIAKINKLRIVYQNKSDVLTTQFATYLADMYPDHEKNIFKDISPEKIDLYLVKYPELQAATTLVKLVDEINKLQTDIYNQDIEKEKLLKTMRYRRVNPWIYHSWIPKYNE